MTGFWAAPGRGGGCECSPLMSEPKPRAEEEARVAVLPGEPPFLRELGRHARDRADDSAELLQALLAAGIAPGMARDDAGIVLRLEDRQDLPPRLHAHVVRLDDHPLAHHRADQVLAERRQALRVAVRPGRIYRQLTLEQREGQHRVEERRHQLGFLVADRGRRVVVVGVVAVVGGPELAGRVLVAGVDEHAARTAVELRAAERVVELVDREHRADAGVVELVELAVDLGGIALRRAVELPAVEHLRHLDPEHDGELAVVDHPPGLGRVADQPEEALPGAAGLSVDVVLQRVHVLGLLVGAGHLVAVVLLVRIELAERTVLDQVGDHEPQPGSPGALDPLPVGALMRSATRPAASRRSSASPPGCGCRPGCRC